MALQPLPMPDNPFVFVVIDPAAGGQQSDYAIVSIVRERGNVTVRQPRVTPRSTRHATLHASEQRSVNAMALLCSLLMNSGITCLRKFMKKFAHLPC